MRPQAKTASEQGIAKVAIMNSSILCVDVLVMAIYFLAEGSVIANSESYNSFLINCV